jgi:hypothetical protein
LTSVVNTIGRMPSASPWALMRATASCALLDAVEEGNADLLELDILELRQQAVAERFGGQAGAIGDEEDGALDRCRHGRGWRGAEGADSNRCCANPRRCR